MANESIKEELINRIKNYKDSDKLIKGIDRVFEHFEKIEKREIEEMNNTIKICFSSIFHRQPNQKNIEEISKRLPENIKKDAFYWEWYDEEVIEMVRDFIKKNV